MNPILLAAASAAPAQALTAPKGAVLPSPGASPVHIQMAPQSVPVSVMQPTWFQMHAGWATHTIAGLFILAAISLVALLAFQTTKQEGLSGTIGGRVESAYRGRLGAEEQLKRITGIAAVTFVVSAFILSLTGI